MISQIRYRDDKYMKLLPLLGSLAKLASLSLGGADPAPEPLGPACAGSVAKVASLIPCLTPP